MSVLGTKIEGFIRRPIFHISKTAVFIAQKRSLVSFVVVFEAIFGIIREGYIGPTPLCTMTMNKLDHVF